MITLFIIKIRMGKLLVNSSRLSSVEYEVFELLPKSKPLRFSDLALVLKKRFSRKYLSSIISRLVVKKRVLRLKRGTFIVPAADPFFEFKAGLGLIDGRGAYVGFASALYFYHFIDERPSTVFVVNDSVSRSFVLGKQVYCLVNLGEKAVGSLEVNGVDFSSVAKTLFDCFLQPQYCGGFSKVASAFSRAKLSKYDWKEFAYYLREYGSGCLSQRIGFLSKKFFKNKVPSFFLKEMKSKFSRSNSTCFLDPSSSRKGKYNSQWKIIENVKLQTA